MFQITIKRLQKYMTYKKPKNTNKKKSVPVDNQKHNLNCDKSSIGLHIHW